MMSRLITHTARPVLAWLLALAFATAPAAAQSNLPNAPTNAAAVLTEHNTVLLTWTDNAQDELGYRIIRESQAGHDKLRHRWAQAGGFTVAADVTEFVDDPGPGVWAYRLRAYNARGNSSYTPRLVVEVPGAVEPSAGGGTTGGSSEPTGGSGGSTVVTVGGGGTTSGGSTGGGTTGGGSTGGGSTGGGTTSGGTTTTTGGQIPGGSGEPTGGEPGTGGGGGGEFPVLTPGNGWTGPTAQPAPVGDPSMAGYDAKAIARWDVVPYQTFTGEFHIGVVAFHMNGIDRVDFSVNGGPWTPVYEMQLNPRTNVWEYTALLRASLFDDGPVEVRAIAWPKGAGEARVLGGEYDVTRAYRGSEWTGEHSIQLFANAGGTIVQEVVELDAGTYTWGVPPLYFGRQLHQDRWLTFRPKDGVDRADVIVNAGTSQVPAQRDFRKVRLRDITIHGHSGLIGWFAHSPENMIWFDGVHIVGAGMHTQDVVGWCQTNHQWWTDVLVEDSRHGFAQQFVRNSTFRRIGENVTKETHTVLNVTVYDVGPAATGWHAGVIANPHRHDNRVFHGVHITDSHGAHPWPFRNGTHNHWENIDIAIVNCVTEVGNPDDRQALFLGGATRHFVVQKSDFIGRISWRTSPTVATHWQLQATDVHFIDCTFSHDPHSHAGIYVHNSH